MLQSLRIILLKAKQELNNDLTKLAIRNNPFIMQEEVLGSSQDEYGKLEHHASTSQLTENDADVNQESLEGEADCTIQELEPLDLDP